MGFFTALFIAPVVVYRDGEVELRQPRVIALLYIGFCSALAPFSWG